MSHSVVVYIAELVVDVLCRCRPVDRRCTYCFINEICKLVKLNVILLYIFFLVFVTFTFYLYHSTGCNLMEIEIKAIL